MASLVVTLVGPDKPGVVGRVADVVRQHGGNWLESRMCHLADQFAGIALVDVPPTDLEALATALARLSAEGLKITTQANVETSSVPPAGSLWALNVVANDRFGIVREITQALAEIAVNVEELSTTCQEAPHGGGSIFRAAVQIRVPAELSTEDLQHRIEHVADDLMIDLTPLSEQSG